LISACSPAPNGSGPRSPSRISIAPALRHLEERRSFWRDGPDWALQRFPDGLTLAIDVDLDTADPLVGLRRTIALGGETRLGSASPCVQESAGRERRGRAADRSFGRERQPPSGLVARRVCHPRPHG
jgi:hypothetical protein